MPDLKISQLTDGNPAQSADQIPINRSGTNFRVTAGSIAALDAVAAFLTTPSWWTSGDGSMFAYDPGNTGVFGTGTGNQIKFWMIRIPQPIQVSKMSVALSVTEASALVGYGIYSADGTTKLFSWDSMDVSTTGSGGSKNITLGSPVVLPAGVYIVACGNSNAGNTASTGGAYSTRGSSAAGDPWNNNGTIRTGVAANPMVAGAMPASLGALSGTSFLQNHLPVVVMEP